MPLFDPRSGVMTNVNVTSLESLVKHRDLLVSVYKTTPKQVLYRGSSSYRGCSIRISFESWGLLEKWLNAREEKTRAKETKAGGGSSQDVPDRVSAAR